MVKNPNNFDPENQDYNDPTSELDLRIILCMENYNFSQILSQRQLFVIVMSHPQYLQYVTSNTKNQNYIVDRNRFVILKHFVKNTCVIFTFHTEGLLWFKL